MSHLEDIPRTSLIIHRCANGFSVRSDKEHVFQDEKMMLSFIADKISTLVEDKPFRRNIASFIAKKGGALPKPQGSKVKSKK